MHQKHNKKNSHILHCSFSKKKKKKKKKNTHTKKKKQTKTKTKHWNILHMHFCQMYVRQTFFLGPNKVSWNHVILLKIYKYYHAFLPCTYIAITWDWIYVLKFQMLAVELFFVVSLNFLFVLRLDLFQVTRNQGYSYNEYNVNCLNLQTNRFG